MGILPAFSQTPVNLVMTIRKDPSAMMAFNWYIKGNSNEKGEVQILKGNKTSVDFESLATPPLTVETNSPAYWPDLPYNGSTISYTEYKALVEDLDPNTTYSFRVGNVGKTGVWSDVGTFTTTKAKGNKDDFSFIYMTDPQATVSGDFDIAKRTIQAADSRYPDANFWLSCGDLVDKGDNEWQYDQFFNTQRDVFLKKPFAPAIGNHDAINNIRFGSRFYTDTAGFAGYGSKYGFVDQYKSTYSFVYGDALFFALNGEYAGNNNYQQAVRDWMTAVIKSNSESNQKVKWHIVYFHKAIYTGCWHYYDYDNGNWYNKDDNSWPNYMTSLFDDLKIDIALQGHDHVYEVIGPVYNKQLVDGAVTNLQEDVNGKRFPENITGKQGGTYNTQKGTLYFLNNSSGNKKYKPLGLKNATAEQIRDNISYFNLFTGRFGQTGLPTYSYMTVSTDTITITTYEIAGNTDRVFDEIKIVKPSL